MGLLPTDSGEIIYCHLSSKIGFPLHSFVRAYYDGQDDPETRKLETRPYHPEYVTDGHGVMMMHYRVEPAGSGHSVYLNIYDKDQELASNAIDEPIQTYDVHPVLADTVRDILKMQVTADYGIVRLDTILVGNTSNRTAMERKIKEVQVQAGRLDSTLRQMHSHEFRMANDVTRPIPSSDPISNRIAAAFAAITSEEGTTDNLSQKYEAIRKLMLAEKTIEGKYRLERIQKRLMHQMLNDQFAIESKAMQEHEQLVPVLVRAATGLKTNATLDNGLVFWYRPSDSLTTVLGSQVEASVRQQPTKLSLTAFPNPVTQTLHVSYHVGQLTSVRVSLLDITGKSLHTEPWRREDHDGSVSLDVHQYPAGIYILALDTDQSRVTRQVVLQP